MKYTVNKKDILSLAQKQIRVAKRQKPINKRELIAAATNLMTTVISLENPDFTVQQIHDTIFNTTRKLEAIAKGTN